MGEGHILSDALILGSFRAAKKPLEPGTSGHRGQDGVGIRRHSHHQLLDGGMFFCLPAGGRLLVDNLHSDVILGRHNPFEIWT